LPIDPRSKGKRGEYSALAAFKSLGAYAVRVPCSGSGHLKGDILLGPHGIPIEVKVRANSFTRIYQWLAHAKALMLKSSSPSEKKEWLLVIPVSNIEEVMQCLRPQKL
jgi:Holliday junction resolvase